MTENPIQSSRTPSPADSARRSANSGRAKGERRLLRPMAPAATIGESHKPAAYPLAGSSDSVSGSQPIDSEATPGRQTFTVRVGGAPVEFELMDEPFDLSIAGIARLDEQASGDVFERAVAAGLGRRRFNPATDEPELCDPGTVALCDLDGYVDLVGGRVPALQQVVVDMIGYYRLESIEAALGCEPGAFTAAIEIFVASTVGVER